MKTELNPNEKLSQCEGINDELNELTNLLNKQKKIRNFCISEGKTYNNQEYTDALSTIMQFEAEISELKSQSRILGCSIEERPQISYDTQSILASSSVTKKDPKLLVQMPKDNPTPVQQNNPKN